MSSSSSHRSSHTERSSLSFPTRSLTASKSVTQKPGDADLEKNGPGRGQELQDPHSEEKAISSDPNLVVVDWEGPEDPENPLNWPSSRKWSAMLVIASMCFLSPLASTLIAPAAPTIAQEFGITNSSVIALIVSIFVLGFAVGPLIASPLSELYGRNLVIQIFMVFFCIFNIACGVAQTGPQIIVFRFLAGCGGAAPISCGAGALTDLFRAHERGRAMAFYAIGILIGPIIGPIAGAWLVERASWRWAIWLIVILSAVLSILSPFTLRETYHPTLLARKADALAKESNDPTKTFTTAHKMANKDRTPATVIRQNLSRPGYLYLMFVTFGGLFEETYGMSLGVANLNYLAPGLGFITGTIIVGTTVDRIYKKLSDKNGGVGKPEFRIPVLAVASVVMPIGLIIYGWAAQYKTHWIVPDIGIYLFSVGIIVTFLAMNTYIADSFKYTASAIAAITVFRSIAGSMFPLFGRAMFEALGLGWGNTLLALIALVLGAIYPTLLWHHGPKIRFRMEES